MYDVKKLTMWCVITYRILWKWDICVQMVLGCVLFGNLSESRYFDSIGINEDYQVVRVEWGLYDHIRCLKYKLIGIWYIYIYIYIYITYKHMETGFEVWNKN